MLIDPTPDRSEIRNQLGFPQALACRVVHGVEGDLMEGRFDEAKVDSRGPGDDLGCGQFQRCFAPVACKAVRSGTWSVAAVGNLLSPKKYKQ